MSMSGEKRACVTGWLPAPARTWVGSIFPSVLSEHSSRADVSGEVEVQVTDVTVQSLPLSAVL